MARFFSGVLPEAFVNTSTTQTVDQDPQFPGFLTIQTFAGHIIDYALSPTGIDVDLERLQQIGGFAQGDLLTNFGDVSGTSSNDVIRGQDLLPQNGVLEPSGETVGFLIVNNPGQNDFEGHSGNDILEGRGGGDFLDGGPGSDTASYDSSPAAVTVTVNDPATAAFVATGGDAQGDVLFSIENAVGSQFADRLTGSSNNNILAGGRGSDTLDGAGGTDTADYSRDLFSPTGLTADRVIVRLGLDGANGTGTEFRRIQPDNFLVQVSVDTLINIENVIATSDDDQIFGNGGANTLDGRNGNDLIDGGFGNDTLIGGLGNDTVTFASHNSGPITGGTISLGLNGADGSASHVITVRVTENDVLRGFENVIGSNFAETINGNEQDNTLAGRGGNDRVNGGAGNDSYDLRGQLQAGSDRYFDQSGSSDKVLITSFNDIASAVRIGNDLVVTLVANFGAFTVIDHFAGRPIESIAAGAQTVTLSTSTIGGNASGLIAGTERADVLDGRGGDDFLYGDRGRDHLLGGEGNDDLQGGKGADTIEGGAGADTLEGGEGPDVFVFAPFVTDGTPGNDVIVDYGEEDLIDLSAFDTTFRALDDDRDGRLEDGESDGDIAVLRDGSDTILSFADGSVRIGDVLRLQNDDFIF